MDIPITSQFIGRDSPTFARNIAKGSVASLAFLAFLPSPGFGEGSGPNSEPVSIETGMRIYAEKCASCHGDNLGDGKFAPPLIGRGFLEGWSDRSVGGLYQIVRDTMPPAAPRSLTARETGAVIAFMLAKNNIRFEEGDPGALDPAELDGILMPSFASTLDLASPRDELPPSPDVLMDRLATYSAVTDSTLAHPPAKDWIAWRRTSEADGFSSLRQINRGNVDKLQLAWGWSLPSGPNVSTPLVRDGIMFVAGNDRDNVIQALDAASGDLLWEHRHKLPSGIAPDYSRSLALYGDLLYFATSDAHVVALRARDGTIAWDVPIELGSSVGGREVVLHGGPIAANGMVIVGTAGSHPGGNVIVALDAATGKEAWRIATIAQPGSVEDRSWNGIPLERRTGGGVWTPGSFDPDTGNVFFGPAPTYDTLPLRDASPGKGHSNDALYTNNTMAISSLTGALSWHFAHRPNDQWDLDWAFERIIADVDFNLSRRRVIITGGKDAIFDVLDAKTGRYLFSVDSGIQNIIKSIDPETGNKNIDETKLPRAGGAEYICPASHGGRNWLPGSYDGGASMLYVPMNETCMDLVPVGAGETGMLSTGVRIRLRPPSNSDGRYGRVEALDMSTRATAWTQRRRAPITSGVLATAGGIVFAGFMDRWLVAYDAMSGDVLWQTRLNDMPNAGIISYGVGGAQFIAVVVGHGGLHTSQFKRLVPEIRIPNSQTSGVFVFRLPQD